MNVQIAQQRYNLSANLQLQDVYLFIKNNLIK